MFGYQREWYALRESSIRIRNILKSRQIGATYYFAREALVDAAKTGDNQIFLSASKAQAHVFRQYQQQFLKDVCDLELRGDPFILSNGAHLHFLGTNSRTAQSYHGHLHMDEYFWIPRFTELNKVASGMAMHARWRKTYFSTPSAINHPAFPFWSGAHYNKGRLKSEHIQLDVSHAALAKGRLCEDGQWRQVVTVEDAVASGCNLFNLDQLKREYSPDEYRNLLMCEFIDDTESVFPLSMLQPCLVDSWVVWDEDFQPFAARPLGDKPVWCGYDPSRVGDGASFVVVAPPPVQGGKYRVLEKHRWVKVPFPDQAEMIRQIIRRYNVAYMGIDCTGPGGIGVHDLVVGFYPHATRIVYSPAVKARMVAKTLNILHHRRLEYDAGWKELSMAMMSIRQHVTPGTNQITYVSGRDEDTGHADLGWALLHALDRSDISAGGDTGRRTILEII